MRSVPEAAAIAFRALVSWAFINPIISYHAPVSALPSAGLSFRVSLLTTIMSISSPGTCEELNTSVVFGVPLMTESCGFQATAACTFAVLKAETISASEVFTTVTSFSASPAFSSPRTSR
ncbi:hypothetical protein D3C76_1376990 [compost metagenome]